tara:strand:+ start:374 stop:856 length:483 start_codon:yes stop_codon:yes gene_type:complete
MNFLDHINKKNIFLVFTIITIFLIDRLTKIQIINHQIDNSRIFVNNYLNLELVWNTGIGFGLLSMNAGIIYNLISAFIFLILIFLIYLIINSNFTEKFLLSMIFAGASGNLFDRIFYYAVPDFIDFHINNFHWFTFNIADIFISIGIILLITKEVVIKKK